MRRIIEACANWSANAACQAYSAAQRFKDNEKSSSALDEYARLIRQADALRDKAAAMGSDGTKHSPRKKDIAA